MITVVGSLKGGSGKSTVTFNLAVWLAMADLQVDIIDLDPQATLRDVAEIREEEGYKPEIIVKDKKFFEKKNFNKADEVLIDIGTSDLTMMKKAIVIADRVIVPVQPSQADIWSTQRFIQFVNKLNHKGNAPEIIGFINRGDTHKRGNRDLRDCSCPGFSTWNTFHQITAFPADNLPPLIQ